MKTFHQLFNEIIGSANGKDVAKLLGKTPSYVSQIRKGDQVPRDELIALVAAKLAPGRLPELLLAAALGRLEKQSFEREALKASVREAFGDLRSAVSGPGAAAPRQTGRTLADFPEAFYPMDVVTGDKREDRGAHITVADFGAHPATPSDMRWVMGLGLAPDVMIHSDKIFLLLDEAKLIERFADRNLLIIGAPAANHLARLANKGAVFRLNYSQGAEAEIEATLRHAATLTRTGLAALQEASRDDQTLSKTMRSLLTGGIFDPTYPDEYVAAKYTQIAGQAQLDFGVLTFAANPFYAAKCLLERRENDHRFVAIVAAGVHHPATAHAVRVLGQDQRDRGAFDRHPYGGVLRVVLDLDIPFAERTELATWLWEDQADSSRLEPDDQGADLLRELATIEAKLPKGELKNLELTAEQAGACRALIGKL